MDRVLTKEFLERELTLEEADYFEEKIFKPALASDCLQHKIDAWTVWSLLNGSEKRRKEREAIGLEKGEHQKAVAAALKMIEDGVPVENISKYTGLPQEQIEQLKNKNR